MTKVKINAFDQDYTAIQGTVNPTVLTTTRTNGYVFNGATNNSDEWKYTRYFPKSGTYRVKIIHDKDSDRGIVDIGLDTDATAIANQLDSYNATSLLNEEYFTTIEVSRGNHDIHFKLNGLGSGSDYIFVLQFAQFDLIDEHPVLGEDSPIGRNGMELIGYATANNTVLDTGTIPAKKFLMVKYHVEVDSAGSMELKFRFNGDSGTNYARRNSQDGATDNTQVTNNGISMISSGRKIWFGEYSIINIKDQEKLVVGHNESPNTAGAGTSPTRNETVGKWDDLTAQITRIQIVDTVQGDDALTSGVIEVWGTD